MSFSQSFSVAQNVTTPGTVILTDDSSGSDSSIAKRRAYLQTSAGAYLVPTGVTTDYNDWAYASSTLSLAVLTSDAALDITVQWLNSSNVVLYTLTQQYCLALFNKQFLYQLVQGLVPPITLDTGYSTNLANLWTAILGAENAVTVGGDIVASQALLDQATYLQQNQSLFF